MEESSSIDSILEFLRKNHFMRAEAALISELSNNTSSNGSLQKLLDNKKQSGTSSSSNNHISDKSVVKEIQQCEAASNNNKSSNNHMNDVSVQTHSDSGTNANNEADFWEERFTFSENLGFVNPQTGKIDKVVMEEMFSPFENIQNGSSSQVSMYDSAIQGGFITTSIGVSSDDWKDCSVTTTVYPSSKGKDSGVSNLDKRQGKKKTVSKEDEDDMVKAFSSLAFPMSHDGPNGYLPRLPHVKIKSEDKAMNFTWEEKQQQQDDTENGFLIGSYLNVPIGQEIQENWLSVAEEEDTSDLIFGFGNELGELTEHTNEYWDSDEYDDDDDVGYIRQTIEDEAWFLGNEVDSPKNDDDDNHSFVEEESYLSGEPDLVARYDGELMDATELSVAVRSIGVGITDDLEPPPGKDGFSFPSPLEEEEPETSLEDEDAIVIQEQAKQIKLQEQDFETFNLRIVHRKNKTGFEEDKNFNVVLNSIIAGRYHVTEHLGSAAFSKAIQAHDLHTGIDVCVKIIKNNKDFFDQSLDEIKLLKYVNQHDPADKYHLLRLYDYFYYKEHLLIVCELLKANLYEFQKFNRESGGEVYFTMPRLQSITIQCLEALKFLHGLGLIHCDLKPENILIKSYSRCEIKVIDLGSSCFETDHLCSYVQSRSYRAPEVILGLPYDKKIDVWSLGCILAELCTGNVLFQNDSPATLLARVIGIIGSIDQRLLAKGPDTCKYFTKNHLLYERNQESNNLEYIIPKKSSLRRRLPMGDQGFIEFVGHLLQVDPKKRPSASEALKHPWLTHPYEPIST